MKNIHFATRVIVPIVPKGTPEGASSQNRSSLQAEINKHKVNIDFTCFEKTPLGRQEVKNAKAAYKASGQKLS